MCLETKWVKNAKKSFSHSRAKKTFYRHIKTFRKPTTFNFVVDDNDDDDDDDDDDIDVDVGPKMASFSFISWPTHF